jgi:hypothetical protein
MLLGAFGAVNRPYGNYYSVNIAASQTGGALFPAPVSYPGYHLTLLIRSCRLSLSAGRR